MSALTFRRVVTGLDEAGNAIVQYDDLIEGKATSPTNTVTNFWTTNEQPMAVDYTNDRGAVKIPREPPAGASVFRYVTIAPGNQRDMHTTKSIDFAVVVAGEIDMEIDNEVFVHFKQGDVLIQQATVHGWQNRGTEPCTIAFVMVSTES